MLYTKAGTSIASGPWKVLRTHDETDESAPSDTKECLRTDGSKSSKLVWLIIPPPGTTSYDVTFGRWVTTEVESGGKSYDAWVADETVSVATGEALFYEQAHYGDPCMAYWTNNVDGSGNGTVLYKHAG